MTGWHCSPTPPWCGCRSSTTRTALAGRRRPGRRQLLRRPRRADRYLLPGGQPVRGRSRRRRRLGGRWIGDRHRQGGNLYTNHPADFLAYVNAPGRRGPSRSRTARASHRLPHHLRHGQRGDWHRDLRPVVAGAKTGIARRPCGRPRHSSTRTATPCPPGCRWRPAKSGRPVHALESLPPDRSPRRPAADPP